MDEDMKILPSVPPRVRRYAKQLRESGVGHGLEFAQNELNALLSDPTMDAVWRSLDELRIEPAVFAQAVRESLRGAEYPETQELTRAEYLTWQKNVRKNLRKLARDVDGSRLDWVLIAASISTREDIPEALRLPKGVGVLFSQLLSAMADLDEEDVLALFSERNERETKVWMPTPGGEIGRRDRFIHRLNQFFLERLGDKDRIPWQIVKVTSQVCFPQQRGTITLKVVKRHSGRLIPPPTEE